MNSPELFPSLLKIVSALAVTVGVMIVVAYLFKKIVKRGAGISNDDLIKILSVKYLGPKSSIMLIDVLDNIMVIGVSSGGISLLAEIVNPESLEPLKDIQGQEGKKVLFPDYLKRLLKGNG